MTSTMTTDQEHENRSDSHAEDDSHGGHQRPSYDDVNVPVVVLVGVISMILTFVTIWFVEGVFYQWKNGLVLERSYDVDNTIQTETIAGQTAKLDGVEEENITSLESVIDDVVKQYQNDHASDEEGTQTSDDHADEHGDGH